MRARRCYVYIFVDFVKCRVLILSAKYRVIEMTTIMIVIIVKGYHHTSSHITACLWLDRRTAEHNFYITEVFEGQCQSFVVDRTVDDLCPTLWGCCACKLV